MCCHHTKQYVYQAATAPGCSFEAAVCSWVVNTVDWNQFITGSNPVPIESFAKYGRIDHLWVNPIKSQ